MAKERNGTWVWDAVRIVAMLLLAAAAALVGYGGLRQQINSNAADDAKVHDQVPKLDTRVTRVEEKVSNLDRNFAEFQRQALDNQQQILEELRR